MSNTAMTRAPIFTNTTRSMRPGLVQRLMRAYEQHRALRDLYSLDDRMLRDIGLSRGQLESAVRGDRR